VTPWVIRLIVANIAVFFLEKTAANPNVILQWIAFVPSLIIVRPWTLITYMFAHDPYGLSHIFWNMLGLFFFGPRVEARLGSRNFMTLYLTSGIAGALLAFTAPGIPLIGASGALYGVMMAFAYFWPRDKILIWGVFPVEARVLVIAYTAIELFSGVGGFAPGIAHFTHLGGFAGAYLYLRWLEKRGERRAQRFRTQSQPKVEDRSLANWRRVNPASAHEINRDELNRILDKIGKSGLSSLTAQERAFLANFVPPDDRVPPVS
jgi:rhomboid family protein